MIIEKASLFEGMSPQLVTEVEKWLAQESHAAGDFLFHQGDPAEYLYVLLDGRVRLSLGEEGLVTQVVGSPGDAFGWSSVVDRDSYVSSAECLVPTRVAKIRSQALARIFEQDAPNGLIFYKRLAALMGRRLVNYYRQLPSAHGERRPAPGG